MEETRFYRLRIGFILPSEFGSEEVTRTAVTLNNVTTNTEPEKFQKYDNDWPRPPPPSKGDQGLFTARILIDYERNLVRPAAAEEHSRSRRRLSRSSTGPCNRSHEAASLPCPSRLSCNWAFLW
jgi:hypothetical protein